MTRPPAYQTYANDLLALFVGLSLTALGAVHRLFLVMWGQAADHCSLIDDDPMLARTVGCSLDDWKGLRHEIQHPARPIFQEKDGRLISPYLKEQATKQRKYRKLQAEKSKKGVEARVTRGLSTGSSMGEARVTSSSSLPSSLSFPSSSSIKKGITDMHRIPFSLKNDRTDLHNGHAWKESFDKFWAAYPRKKNKGDAEQWFATHHPAAELVEQMLVTIAAFKTADDWQKDKGKWVPLPGKWLDKQCWEDVVRVDVPPKPRRLVL